jgi:hypothetical protein
MFSLRALLFAVAIAGLGTAGLIHRTQLWASALVALTLGILLFGVCRAWFGSNCTRFWGPFALVGGVYLGIVSVQPLADLHYNLPTTQLVVYGLDNIQTPQNAPTPPAANVYGGYGAAPGYGQTGGYGRMGYGDGTAATTVRYDGITLFRLATSFALSEGFAVEARAFLWVAQCLWCLLLAAVAGVTCSWLVRRRETSRPMLESTYLVPEVSREER